MGRKPNVEKTAEDTAREGAYDGLLNILCPGMRVGEALEQLSSLTGIGVPVLKAIRYGNSGLSADNRAILEKLLAERIKDDSVLQRAASRVNLDALMRSRARTEWLKTQEGETPVSRAKPSRVSDLAVHGATGKLTANGHGHVSGHQFQPAVGVTLANGMQLRIGNGTGVQVVNRAGILSIETVRIDE